MDYSTLPDIELVTQLKINDQKAFSEIYGRYWAPLLIYARKILKDENDAEDCVQEVFAYIWKKRNEINIATSFLSYLFTSVGHKAITIINRKKKYDVYLDSLAGFLERGANFTDEYVLERELLQSILKAISELSPRSREIFMLSRFEQLSHKRIAELLNISDRTVKNQISRGMKILKLKLIVLCLLSLLKIIHVYEAIFFK